MNARFLRSRWTIAIVVVIIAALAPWLVSAYTLTLLGRFLAMSILAIGLVLLWGEAGILSLGQGVFFGLGGYVIAMNLKQATLGEGEIPDFMTWSGLDALPWWWTIFSHPLLATLGVILVPAAVGAVFSWLVFRRRVGGVYFALITQALALCFATLLVSQQQYTGGFNGLTDFKTLFGFDLGAIGTIYTLYWVTVALVVAAFAITYWLLATRYGKLLRATRDGENRVRFLGYDPAPYKVIAFTIAAAFAGVAGALFTLHAGVVSPALVGVVPSIEMVIWVAIGGRKSLWGAIAGTLIVNFARDQISSALPSLWLYALGLAFVLVVTFLPEGLAGLGVNLVSRLTKRSGPAPAGAAPIVRAEG
ncbi:urea ABC transporter, permease protein UrtC [Methylocella silvestris BL2]|uniref:Urea ABC transporter, permease protein UrtC n=1 Tax=Methylocella silvestris (strain DSM 15510 / CIP 108128 / LMG 27833 / NCIMB 13906 / BL2) TaxID=395965 RepID=B8EPU3_METSB|nr:urea ABC transporter permease subunit UrtC [Methylocella silvestris]ACK50947.1 urea ABC transporter, permease protein UrtC [Methylocella silvestris BL2]